MEKDDDMQRVLSNRIQELKKLSLKELHSIESGVEHDIPTLNRGVLIVWVHKLENSAVRVEVQVCKKYFFGIGTSMIDGFTVNPTDDTDVKK